MKTLNINPSGEEKAQIDKQEDVILMALIEGELSGESDLSVLDIIKQQKESLR